MNNSHKEIITRLDILITLLIPRFEKDKYSIKGIALDILRLADGEHTVDDMMKEIKKPRQIIDNNLSKLRKHGLVKSISKEGRNYYVRLL